MGRQPIDHKLPSETGCYPSVRTRSAPSSAVASQRRSRHGQSTDRSIGSVFLRTRGLAFYPFRRRSIDGSEPDTSQLGMLQLGDE